MSLQSSPRVSSTASIETGTRGVQTLLELLKQERGALQLGEDERWSVLSRAKLPLLRDLGALVTQLEAQPAALPPLTRQSLRLVLTECLRLNRDNGVLLETRATRARHRLQKLKGAASQYDGRGRERFFLAGSVRGQA